MTARGVGNAARDSGCRSTWISFSPAGRRVSTDWKSRQLSHDFTQSTQSERPFGLA